ncbi:oligosaccharide flippase family protein [Candidatus Methanoperedens nitratireducens]|uniref:Membrane protein involved in the export of O-antigen and teichoic acid n=1 Tax=Candidatus Methanoperedens nitratireducens TaxID=1392998 RepID=A0A284VUK0_9EURY|nr:oligosaccharide flippase family protein [Candidatus Methanoperedens nitroreducens]SNQ62976.1 Membrane protein involved in the export of O-antigen and teichoic acid [Candidatus Methanoperedens nitroreducens]
MKDIAISLIGFSYEKIFHEKMGNDAKGFLKNLSYIVIASGIAAILSTSFNIFAGRVLGPSEYGEFTLIQTIAMFLLVPMMLGIDTAMITYTAEKNKFDSQSSIISTTFILVTIFTLVSVSIYYLFSSQISKIFSISTDILYLAVIFAFLSVISTFATGTLRSLHKMKEYAIFQPLPNLILLLIFFVFFFSNYISFKSALFSMYIAFGVTGLLMIYSVKKYLRPNFKLCWAKRLIRYGLYMSLMGLASVFYANIDKIIIYKFLTTADIGIYRSYYFSSINFVGLFIGMFIAVFYPLVCKYKDKKVILNRINRVILYLVILGLPIIIFFEFIILKLYGDDYPFDIKLAFLFGIGGLLTCINSIYSWLINSIGTEGIKVMSIAAIIVGVINLVLNFLLIPMFGLVGGVIAFNVSYAINTAVLFKLRHIL